MDMCKSNDFINFVFVVRIVWRTRGKLIQTEQIDFIFNETFSYNSLDNRIFGSVEKWQNDQLAAKK